MSLNLSTELASLKLKTPVILASGILGNKGDILKRIALAGAGAVTTKTISLEPREGHETPNILFTEKGFMNAMGLPNPGVDKFIKELDIAKQGGVPVIVSVVGESPTEYAQVAKKIGTRADIIELNLSCPNVEGGMLFCQDKKLAAAVVKVVKKETTVPVFAKLGPNVSNIAEIAKAVEQAGADGITAINTMPSMAIDIETGLPVLKNKYGGMSGVALKPIAIRCVFEIAGAVKIPIIGTGGVSTGADAAEMLMAGASAVGIGTAIIENGFETFAKISKELEQFMLRKKLKSIKELVGLTHKFGGAKWP